MSSLCLPCSDLRRRLRTTKTVMATMAMSANKLHATTAVTILVVFEVCRLAGLSGTANIRSMHRPPSRSAESSQTQKFVYDVLVVHANSDVLPPANTEQKSCTAVTVTDAGVAEFSSNGRHRPRGYAELAAQRQRAWWNSEVAHAFFVIGLL